MDWGFCLLNDNMELEREEMKNKSYKKCYTVYERMLKRIKII